MMKTDVQNSAIEQFIIYLVCIAVGIMLSFLFDIFRIRRQTFKSKDFLVHFEDILFWIICMLIVPSVIYIVNYGEIRGYLIIGIVTGVLFYMLFISKLVINLSVPIVLFVKGIITKLLRIFLIPIKFVFSLIEIAVNFILKLISIYTGKAYRKVEYDLFKMFRKLKIIILKK